ncbi:indolepyruvate oxidoreductase subunit beta [bacterium]|nr:indolepyruvate oxidoreductase subunit beta [bacterium]
MSKITNCMLVGVGGQGILLASSMISNAAMACGMDIKNNEVHGMAQRGGSVAAQIRFGEEVYSPLVKKGKADFLIALEVIEALRYADFLSPQGKALVSTQRIIPTTVSAGPFEYPDDPEELVRRRFSDPVLCPCMDIAAGLGEPRASNIVMTGLLSRYLPFPEQIWIDLLKKQIKPEYLAVNIEAFVAGRHFHEPVLE